MALRSSIFVQNPNTFTSTIAATWASGWTGGSPQAGDLVIALVGPGNGGSHGSITVTPPAGFSAVPGVTNGQNLDAGGLFVSAYYYIATGSESGSATFTFGSTSNQSTLQMVAFSGRNTSSPFSAVATTTPVARAGSSPTTFAVTGLTAVAGDDILYMLECNTGITLDATKTFTPPSGYANGTLNWSLNGAPIIVFCDKENVSTGSTGTLGGSLALTTSGNAVAYTGYLLSLASASSPIDPGLLTGRRGGGSGILGPRRPFGQMFRSRGGILVPQHAAA